MFYTGFADEAGPDIDTQIKATKELGWKYIETRQLFGKNLAYISDDQFDEVRRKTEEAGIEFNCYGSGIANWQKPITESPDSSYDEMKKAIPRMQKLGIKMARVMSFAVPKELREKDFFEEVVKRLKVIVSMAQDAGIVCVHENCMNWGGLSPEHSLRLFEAIDSPCFKAVFDTGNPVFNDDVRGEAPYKKQDSLEFYRTIKEFVVHVHIKDGKVIDGKDVFMYPGEGDGQTEAIIKELLRDGYDGAFSIEPHMASVFHAKEQDVDYEQCYSNYIEYGKRFMNLVDRVRKEL